MECNGVVAQSMMVMVSGPRRVKQLPAPRASGKQFVVQKLSRHQGSEFPLDPRATLSLNGVRSGKTTFGLKIVVLCCVFLCKATVVSPPFGNNGRCEQRSCCFFFIGPVILELLFGFQPNEVHNSETLTAALRERLILFVHPLFPVCAVTSCSFIPSFVSHLPRRESANGSSEKWLSPKCQSNKSCLRNRHS